MNGDAADADLSAGGHAELEVDCGWQRRLVEAELQQMRDVISIRGVW